MIISVINMKTTFRQISVLYRGKETLVLTYHLLFITNVQVVKFYFIFLKIYYVFQEICHWENQSYKKNVTLHLNLTKTWRNYKN